MKLRLVVVLLAIAGLASAADAPREEKKAELPRLTNIGAFPEKDRAAVRAVIAAVSDNGGKPQEYFAELTPAKDGQLDVYLKHESHPDEDGSRGDICGLCRITRFDSKTGKVEPFRGIK